MGLYGEPCNRGGACDRGVFRPDPAHATGSPIRPMPQVARRHRQTSGDAETRGPHAPYRFAMPDRVVQSEEAVRLGPWQAAVGESPAMSADAVRPIILI